VVIILPCCWCPVKYVISNGYIVKGARLAPVSPDLPGLGLPDVPQGPGTGMLIKILFSWEILLNPKRDLSIGVSF
jgi:hypothetical protein